MTPKKPYWIELADNDNASVGIRKVNKKLPIATLVTAGVLILGGSLFANTNSEPSAVAQSTTTSPTTTSPTTMAPTTVTASTMIVKSSPTLSTPPIPTVTNAPVRGDENEDREDD